MRRDVFSKGEMVVIEVKNPILLDSNLNVSTILHPTKGNLTLNMNAVSEASLTLREQDEQIPMHGWVKLYNQLGFVAPWHRYPAGQRLAGLHGFFRNRDGIPAAAA